MKTAWLHILLSLAEADRHGSAIHDDARGLSGGTVRLWPATLYGSLEELAEREWIRELSEGERPAEGGRERFYRITPRGRDALRSEIERLEGIADAGRRRLQGRRA